MAEPDERSRVYFDNAVETRHSDAWRLLQYGADGEAKGSGFQADELEKKPRRLLHEKKSRVPEHFCFANIQVSFDRRKSRHALEMAVVERGRSDGVLRITTMQWSKHIVC